MVQAHNDSIGHGEGTTAGSAESPSVLRMVNAAHRQLEHVLFNLQAEPDAQNRILEIARMLMAATDRNPDIALACILLNQEEGSYAVRHCIDSAVVALLVARALGQVPSETLTTMAAALTMNVGMLPSQEQLQSRLNAISRQEIALIQRHPEQSVEMLKAAGVTDNEWLTYVLLHHENEDGSGYPFGKKGEEVPLNAKIIALADRYCARVSSRSYRKSLLPNEALSDILLADHQSVDPMLTTCFIRVLGIYPTGAMVRMANGEVGIVAGRGSSSTTPLVHAMIAANGAPLPAPVVRNTADTAYAVREMLNEERAGVRFTMHQVWGEEARP